MPVGLRFDVSTPTSFGPGSLPEKRKAGRPRLAAPKRPRANPRERPTRLSLKRPVKTGIPDDIWDLVFCWCAPNDLQNLRKVCSVFRDLISLDHSTIWAHSRLVTYGEGCPNRPKGLNEQQYTDLIKGQGCMGCKAKPYARKTYWVWQRRWCKACFQSKTIHVDSLHKFQHKYPGLIECLRRAKADSWNRYEMVWREDEDERLISARTCFLKSDIEAIIVEFEDYLASIKDKSKEEQVQMLESWRENKRTEAEEYMDHIYEIEMFFNGNKRTPDDAPLWKDTRVQFYRTKAQEMVPPMNEDVLDIIPAYQRAIVIPRKPTLRSWDELRPKLEEVRNAAEAQVEELMLAKNSDRRVDYPKIHADRVSRPSAGQKLVLSLADKVLEESEEELEKTAYQDVVQLFLRLVWSEYDKIPTEDRPKAENGDLSGPHESYRLCLADLVDVYTKFCMQTEDTWSAVNRAEAQFFKCPGCTSTQYNKKWRFLDLFIHLRHKHSRILNSPWKEYQKMSVHFGMNVEFPWAAIEWPCNLPVLAPDQTATGTWDPNDTAPVLQRPRTPSSRSKAFPSAFDDRSAKKDGLEIKTKSGLVESIIEVDSLFKDKLLPDNFKTLIAWQYAIERYEASGPKTLREDEQALTDLDIGLLRMGSNCTILNKLLCKSCSNNNRLRSHVGYGMLGNGFHKIVNHFQRHHGLLYGQSRPHWKSEMLQLPTGQQLLAALSQPGAEDARAVFDLLFPLTSSDEDESSDEESRGDAAI